MNQAGGEGHLRPRRKLCGGTSDTAIVAAMCVLPPSSCSRRKIHHGVHQWLWRGLFVGGSLQASPESHTNIWHLCLRNHAHTTGQHEGLAKSWARQRFDTSQRPSASCLPCRSAPAAQTCSEDNVCDMKTPTAPPYHAQRGCRRYSATPYPVS